MTLSAVNCNGVLIPKIQEPITMLHLTATCNSKVSSQLSVSRANNSLYHVAVEVLSVKIVLMIILRRLVWNMNYNL